MTLEQNKTYEVVCLSHLQAQLVTDEAFALKHVKQELNDLMNEGLKSGEIVPLNRSVFEMDQVEEAFRFLASGKHIGKVMIKIRDEVAEPTPQDNYHTCLAQTFFNPEKSYIIVGGLGGFGLEVAKWMVDRGATKLVLTSRSGPRDAYQKLVIHNLQNHPLFKTSIVLSTQDCLNEQSANSVISEAEKLGSVGGVFMLAMVLKDGLFENQTKIKFEQVYGSKGRAGVYLDKLTRQRCPHLDYFVCFSSLVSNKGNAGQSNYGYANSALERLCEKRRKDGLHGIAIQWGALGDVGFVTDLVGGNDFQVAGSVTQRLPSFFQTLDKFLLSSHSVVSSIVLVGNKVDYEKKESLLTSVFHILGIKDPSKVDPNSTLGDLGIDSLMLVEIKQGLERDYNIVMSTQDIRNLKVKEIAKIDEDRKNNVKITSIKSNLCKDNQNGFNLLALSNNAFTDLTRMTGRPVFFLPAAENDFTLLTRLADLLSRPVIGLNWVKEIDKLESISEVGKFYAQKLHEKYPDNNEFELIGYSFGGLVALETCKSIQEQLGYNYIRNLIMLDSSPCIMKELSKKMMIRHNELNESYCHLEALWKIVNFIKPLEDSAELKNTLFEIEDPIKRCIKMTEYLQSKFNLTVDSEKLNNACESYISKLKMMYNYSSTKLFQGDVILIHSSERFDNNLPSDFGFSEVS